MMRLMKINISILSLTCVVLLCCAFIPTKRGDSQKDLNKNDISVQDALKNVPTEYFGIDGVDELNNLPIYFHLVDNKRKVIDVKIFDELLQKNPFEHSDGWLISR